MEDLIGLIIIVAFLIFLGFIGWTNKYKTYEKPNLGLPKLEPLWKYETRYVPTKKTKKVK